MDDRQATHVTPPAGANAWFEPHPDADRLPRLGPNESVTILESRGVWALVQTEAGREAWIDGRRLQPHQPAEPAPAQAPSTALPPELAPEPDSTAPDVKPVEIAAQDAKPTPHKTRRVNRRWLALGLVIAVGAAAVGAKVFLAEDACGANPGAPILPRATDEVTMSGADPTNSNDFGDNLAPVGPKLAEYWCSDVDNRFDVMSISGLVGYASDWSQDSIVELDLRTGEALGSFPGRSGITALDGAMLYWALSDVTAVDLTSGAEVWAFETPGLVFNSLSPVGDLLVFYVDDDADETSLYALDTSTGVPQWSQSELDSVTFGLIAVDASTVVFVDREQILTFDLSNGSPGPSFQGSISGGVVAVHGVIVFKSVEGGLSALDLMTASLLWESGQSIRSAPAVAVDESIVVSLSFGGDSIDLMANDLTSGRPLWRHDTGQDTGVSVVRPAIANGVAYFAVNSTIYAMSISTGELRWSEDVGIDVASDIVIANGLLVFAGTDSKFHAFGDR